MLDGDFLQATLVAGEIQEDGLVQQQYQGSGRLLQQISL